MLLTHPILQDSTHEIRPLGAHLNLPIRLLPTQLKMINPFLQNALRNHFHKHPLQRRILVCRSNPRQRFYRVEG